MTKNYICNSSKYAYGKGYITLPLPLLDIPETITVEGQTLYRKSSFHVSLVCVKDLVSANAVNGNDEVIEQSILDCFCSAIKSIDISFLNFSGEPRLAKDGERVTVVALCDVSGMQELVKYFTHNLNIQLPEQPTHVTLYTLQPDAGIGLNSPEDMRSKSTQIEVPESVRVSLGLE